MTKVFCDICGKEPCVPRLVLTQVGGWEIHLPVRPKVMYKKKGDRVVTPDLCWTCLIKAIADADAEQRKEAAKNEKEA